MAWSAHKTEEEMREITESPQELNRKLDDLASLIKQSSRLVAFTGAGISTAAGIPDFRGPKGVWTMRAQGKSAKAKTSTERAFPTPTHMSLAELERVGHLRFLISQNCDGIHRRSGYPVSKLAELHGNGNLEYCKACGAEFLRDFGCHARSRNINDHRTGRLCTCGQPLHDSIIHFGENLPEKALRDGFREARSSDVMLVLGSSLTVTPACDMPKQAAEKGAHLVIVNLQKTPLDGLAKLRIHGRTDEVMSGLMTRLGLTIPAWHIVRYLSVGIEGKSMTIRGEDAAGVPSLFLNAVKVKESGRDGEIEQSGEEVFHLDVPALKAKREANLNINVQFLGYFNEPATSVSINYNPAATGDLRFCLDFDTSTATWNNSLVLID